MSNIFQFTPNTYFQIPDAALETGKWARLKPSAQALYVLLLHTAQKESSPFVSVTAVDAAKVGLSVNSVKEGRNALVESKLIATDRTSEGYDYEILDPLTGASLERIADVTKVSADIVGLYFLEYLSNRHHVETIDGLRCSCPFHDERKQRDTNLSVTFADGGAFHCFGCDAQGGILDFETRMAAKDGEMINRDRAFSRVRQAHLSNLRKDRKRQARDAAAARANL